MQFLQSYLGSFGCYCEDVSIEIKVSSGAAYGKSVCMTEPLTWWTCRH